MIASNGQQALERAATEKPNLVVTDFMMPVTDEAALVKAMRADPQLTGVPVVIMSSIPEATVVERKCFNIFTVVDLVAELTKA